jgi:hypothetical protein
MTNKTKGNFFLCIGAQKAGTSWLDMCLREHPDVAMPPFKELHFFNEMNINTSLKNRFFSSKWQHTLWRNKLKETIKFLFYFRIKEFLWSFRFLFLKRNTKSVGTYKKQLQSLSKTAHIYGEITPAYSILQKKIIKVIEKEFPDLKIILILRNPVDREWSHSKMMFLNMNNKSDTDKLDNFKSFFNKKVLRGDYMQTIKNWLSCFSKDQILICFYDKLKDNPFEFLKEITDFLGLSQFDTVPVKDYINLGVQKKISPEFEEILTKNITI